MSFKVLVIGIFLQILFAVFQFMAVVFAGGAAANSGTLKPWQMTTLDLSIIFIPSVSIFVCILLVFLYGFDSQYLSNWWHAIPFITLVIYIIFVFSLNGK
jgi:hypothetical protein